MAAALVLATVGGAYFGARALSITWAFWALLVSALVWAVGVRAVRKVTALWRRVRELVEEGRKHPQTLKAAGQYQEDWKAVSSQLRDAQDANNLRFADGIAEGRRRAAGELMAVLSDASLEPLAMTLREGRLVMSAKTTATEEHKVGSMWCLRVKGVGDVKAVLRTIALPDDLHVVLELDRALDESVVDALSKVAAETGDVPASMEISTRPFSSVQDLMKEVTES